MSVYSIYISIVLFFVSAFYVLQWTKNYKKVVQALSKIQGPRGWFIFGNINELAAQPEDMFDITLRLRKDYGPLYCLWLFNKPVVIISKAEYLEKILSSTVEIQKSFFYDFLHPWLGTGLLTSSGSKWRSHRKMITPTFHFMMLESFIDIFVEKSEKFLKCLKMFSPGSEFDVYPLLHLLMLDVICNAAMGVDVNAQELKQTDNANKDFVTAHSVLTKALTEQMFKPWLWNNWIFDKFTTFGKQRVSSTKTLHNYALKVIDERKLARQKLKEIDVSVNADDQFGIKKKKGLLDVLLDANEEGSNLTNIEIREEVDTFMFAGNDTTENALAWNLLMIGNHPDVQNKIVEELNSIYEDSNRRITSADLVKMKYLERVIKETLRLYPSVPAVGRTLKNDLELDDVVIPAGTELKLEFGTIHRDPQHFENPDVFDPDNFLPEKVRTRHPYSYLAFSAGPRNCIGQKFALNQIKVVLATFLRNFKVECVHKPEEVPRLTEMTLRPKHGIKLRIYPRSNV